jgi:hypothetical protein
MAGRTPRRVLVLNGPGAGLVVRGMAGPAGAGCSGSRAGPPKSCSAVRRAPPLVTILMVPAALSLESAVTRARLTDRELRSGTGRELAFHARQRGPDERPMHAPFLLRTRSGRRRLVRRGRLRRSQARHRFGRRSGRLGRRARRRRDQRRSLSRTHPSLRHGRQDLLVQGRRGGLLLPLRRKPAPLVRVFPVAGRASSLPDFLPDHRDDGMVGEAALARTVIVQDVTEPKLTLLHHVPRTCRWRD